MSAAEDSERTGRAFFEEHYWTFLELRDRYAELPQPALRWWSHPTELNQVDRTILEALEGRGRVLDLGAGDLTVKRKLRAAGLAADYRTLDPSREFEHDYASLDEVPRGAFDAVMPLEVIEHIPLADFWGFMDGVFDVLAPDGVLVISTPNAEFVSGIWAADMTHVHAYRAVDLAAFLHCRGFESELYRVAWRSPHDSLRERVRFQLARILTRGILQVDYARGVLVVAERVRSPDTPA